MIARSNRSKSGLFARTWMLWILGVATASSAGSDDRAIEQDFDCLITARQEIAVSSPIEGAIDEILVDRGDLVQEGQVLARLETSVERAAVEEARERARMEDEIEAALVSLDFARRNLERRRALHRRQAESASLLDEAETRLRLAELELQEMKKNERIARLALVRAEAELERRTIRSPVDGVVVERILARGEYADPPQIVRVAEVDPLLVKVIVPVRHLAHFKLGMEAVVTAEGPLTDPLRARVTAIDRVIDAASGTFGVRLTLPNPDLSVPAGLRCRMRLAAPRP